MGSTCGKCGMFIYNQQQHSKWCGNRKTALDTGTWFQSAVSGLWYQSRLAAGDIAAVKIDGALYVNGPSCPELQEARRSNGVAQAALRLNDYLRANVGHNADWPIHLHADNVADADQLAAHLRDFSKACADYRRAAEGTAGQAVTNGSPAAGSAGARPASSSASSPTRQGWRWARGTAASSTRAASAGWP